MEKKEEKNRHGEEKREGRERRKEEDWPRRLESGPRD
jgi:hypothetical protein